MREQSLAGDEAGRMPVFPLSVFSRLMLALLVGTLPLIAIVTGLVGLRTDAIVLSLCVYLAAGALALGLLKRGFPHPTLGAANLVTTFRLVVVAGLVSGALYPSSSWLIVVLATGALILDGVDGYLARRQNRVSEFGARFDMEIDTALAVVLAIIAAASGLVGLWVLLLAMPRYLFVIAAKFLPWLWAELPYSLARRVVSVLQITALIVINAPIFGGVLALPVAASAAALLLWSFGRDVIWLFKARA